MECSARVQHEEMAAHDEAQGGGPTDPRYRRAGPATTGYRDQTRFATNSHHLIHGRHTSGTPGTKPLARRTQTGTGTGGWVAGSPLGRTQKQQSEWAPAVTDARREECHNRYLCIEIQPYRDQNQICHTRGDHAGSSQPKKRRPASLAGQVGSM